MTTPRENGKDLMTVEDNMTEYLSDFQKSPENPQSLAAEDVADMMMLQTRIDEDSTLISMLKHRADELLLRYEALKKVNTELEDKVALYRKDLDSERQKSAVLEDRFKTIAAYYQAILAFMEEHKNENVQLKLENTRLQSENNSLFSQKLHDGEVFIQKLTEEMKLLREENVNNENEHREKLSACELKLQEQTDQHKAKEALLLSELHDAQQQHADVLEMCKDLKLKLEKAEDRHALKEINLKESIANLSKDNDKILCLSIERGKVIQEKQKEIQLLEAKWREEREKRTAAQEMFKQEAEAVNADLRVKSLQSALDESAAKLQEFTKNFEAFREHSANLLAKERELNKKLAHMKI